MTNNTDDVVAKMSAMMPDTLGMPAQESPWMQHPLTAGIDWDDITSYPWCLTGPTVGQRLFGIRREDGEHLFCTWEGTVWGGAQLAGLRRRIQETDTRPDVATIATEEPTASCLAGFYPVHVVDGYKELFDELIIALNQSQKGKGKERHANERPFTEQPILTLSRIYGPGGPAQQVGKKSGEAIGMFNRGEYDRAIAELHGSIVYAAATILAIREVKAEVRNNRT